MRSKNEYLRTDLACESAQMAACEAPEITEYEREGFSFASMTVCEDESEAIGRRPGRYVTAFAGRMTDFDEDRADVFSRALGAELRELVGAALGAEVSEETSVLVCGLGNRSVTPDAIGPRVVDLLTVTRHLAPDAPFSRVSAIAPGTLGQTGIEAAEQLSGAVRETKPDAVIAVDALASRATERLATTVQICDSGISPGSGVGNARREISRETLDVPVIALGVPTVVDSATLVSDALEAAGLGEYGDEVRRVLDEGRNMFVSPRDCDVIAENVAAIVAAAIEYAFGIREMGMKNEE